MVVVNELDIRTYNICLFSANIQILCPNVQRVSGNTLEGDVSEVIALDQLTSPFSPRKATRMSP